MLRPPRPPATTPISPLRRRVLNTVAIAGVGVAAGLAYAQFWLPPETLTDRQRSMYGTMGAVVAVLGVRLAAIIRAVLLDYFGEQ